MNLVSAREVHEAPAPQNKEARVDCVSLLLHRCGILPGIDLVVFGGNMQVWAICMFRVKLPRAYENF